jgi:hypothetical protein
MGGVRKSQEYSQNNIKNMVSPERLFLRANVFKGMFFLFMTLHSRFSRISSRDPFSCHLIAGYCRNNPKQNPLLSVAGPGTIALQTY